MEKVAPDSKFVGHSIEIIQQSKIKGPLIMVIMVTIFSIGPIRNDCMLNV